MVDRLNGDIEHLPTETPAWKKLDSVPTEAGADKGRKGNWEQDFYEDFGHPPTKFEELEMQPFDPRAVLRGGKGERRFFDVAAYSPQGSNHRITDDADEATKMVQEAPVGSIISLDRSNLRRPKDVLFFKKLRDGRLQPLRAPGPVQELEIEDQMHQPINPRRGIADTVPD